MQIQILTVAGLYIEDPGILLIRRAARVQPRQQESRRPQRIRPLLVASRVHLALLLGTVLRLLHPQAPVALLPHFLPQVTAATEPLGAAGVATATQGLVLALGTPRAPGMTTAVGVKELAALGQTGTLGQTGAQMTALQRLGTAMPAPRATVAQRVPATRPTVPQMDRQQQVLSPRALTVLGSPMLVRHRQHLVVRLRGKR